jgi:tetratricopeptide (TPR) repeat protein
MTASGKRPIPASPFVVQQHVANEFSRIGRLMVENKVDDAWAAANALYAEHPDNATANFTLALILDSNLQKADALEYAEAAVKFAPDNVRNLTFLGKLYVDLGMIEFAPKVLHKAFSLDASAYQAPWALATYYLHSGQGGRALPYFEMALKAAPAAARTEILSQRAECLRATARLDEAEADYDAVMAVPHLRVMALTQAALLRKNDQNSDYAEKIRRMLVEPGLSDRERSMLLQCLGRLFEIGRDYDQAFAHFEAAGKALNFIYDPSEFDQQVSDNIKVFTPDVFARFRSYGDDSEKPFFIVGMPRSGTTMTEQIIAAHSQAEGVGELDRMSRMAASFSSRSGMQEVLDTMSKAGPVEWKKAPQQYLNLIDALAPEVPHTVDKMPHNFMSLGFIHLCFPNARIVHARRNPLDNFISAFQNPMTLFHGYAFDQVAYGKYYVRYLELMDHWQKVVPTRLYESRYETLTANPEAEVRKLLGFLGLPWEEACLRFNERESTVRTFSQLQVRNPINTASVARWRRYEKHLAPIMGVLDAAGVDFRA